MTLSDVIPEPVKWLWPGRIAYGKLTVLEGDPDEGKSQVTIDLAARVTRGKTLPTGESVVQGNVLVLTAEDGLADTVRPRLDAAHGDPARVRVLRAVVDHDGTKRLPSLPGDIERLRSAISETGAKLVIFDALTAYLGGDTNTWSDHSVRRALSPLAQLAEETGVAVIVIMHLNKGADRAAMYRGGGSIAFVAVPRSVLLAAHDPKDKELHILASVKSNLGPKPVSFSYRIIAVDSTSRVEWQGESPYDAETLLARQDHAPTKGPKSEGAEAFLRRTLASGPRCKTEVVAEGERAGHTKRTLERAFKGLGGLWAKDFGERAWWQLPQDLAKPSYAAPLGETGLLPVAKSLSVSEQDNFVNSEKSERRESTGASGENGKAQISAGTERQRPVRIPGWLGKNRPPNSDDGVCA